MNDVELNISSYTYQVNAEPTVDFRSKKVHDIQQRIVRLSRDSLLSLATQFVMHYSSGRGGEVQTTERRRSSATTSLKQEKIRVPLDHQSVSVRSQVVKE